MRKCNDDVTPIFDWLYLGGVKNTRKTLPYVDIWYDFKHDTRYPKNLVVPSTITHYHIPFDDGDLDVAIPIWTKCFHEIMNAYHQKQKVFISCYEGVSRSVILAFWVACEVIGNYEEALLHIKNCRNIHPDKKFEPFIEKLRITYK